MNTFILGAGFTKAIFPNAPLNGDLLDVLTRDSSQSVSRQLIDRYGTRDIETALTRLDMDILSPCENSASYVQDLRSLRHAIESELASHFSSYCVNDAVLAAAPWLSQFIDHGFRRGDVAVCLNYDCVLEGALDCRCKWSPNGGYGSLSNPMAHDGSQPKTAVRVLKIHGSTNFVIAPYLDKPDASAVAYSFDERVFPRSAKRKHFGFGFGVGKSYIIAPSYVKIPTVEISYLMIDALRATTGSSNLIIVGSSLRPEDTFLTVLITNFLRQPNWRDRRIIIVDPSASQIAARLAHHWGVNVSEQLRPMDALLQHAASELLSGIALKPC